MHAQNNGDRYYRDASSIRFAAGAGEGEGSSGVAVGSTGSNGGGALRSWLFCSSHLSIASLRLANGLGPRREIMSSLGVRRSTTAEKTTVNINAPGDHLLLQEQLRDLLDVILVLCEKFRCTLMRVTAKAKKM